jgi:hypothetical protein
MAFVPITRTFVVIPLKDVVVVGAGVDVGFGAGSHNFTSLGHFAAAGLLHGVHATNCYAEPLAIWNAELQIS